MEPTIHQLYCTHCTYGTSYQHQRTTGAVKDQVFEYGARAGSMAREQSEDYFQKLEPFMNYHLPGDLPGDQMLKHDAGSTADWRRFVYLPSVGGMQALACVSYRTTDTQGRPGSYFAHVLLAERPNGEPVWSAADALKLWGSPNWVVCDGDFPNLQLKTVRSLDEFRTSGPRTARMIDDQVLLSFLMAPIGTPFDDPGQLIPARWKQKSPSERRELLIDTLQSFLELNFERRQTMLLAIEPCLSALIFYGVARLLPKTGIGEKLSFSTFESHEQRPQTALAATTFVDVENSELPRDPSQSRGFAINTFKPPEKSPALSWKQRKEPPQYARKLVQLLIDGGKDEVGELLLAFEKAGAASKEDLEELIQADAFSDAFLAGDSQSAAARLKTLREPATKYLRKTVQSRLAKIIARSGPSITAAPPPPPSSLLEKREAGTAATTDVTQLASPPPPPMSTAWPGSAELRQITEQPARVLDILKLIAAEDAPNDAQPVVAKLLAAYVEHGRDQFDRLLRTEGLAKAHKRHALRIAVERHKQIPTGCDWLWTETKAVSGQPALLTTLLLDLDNASATALLTGFLETQPASDKVSPVCDALAQVGQTQESKRELLVKFVDHPQLPAATLLSALRISSTIRKPVFEQYAKFRQDQPELDFRLPGLLESSVKNLTEPREFSRLLDLLNDGRPLLWNEDAARVDGWLKIRKRLEEIKNLLADEPSVWSRLRGDPNDAKLQEHGLELAKVARHAMPDKLYEIDHKGEERCNILESIGEQLLKPSMLPDSFWRKLSSAMSGNGWQILSSIPRSRRRRPAKSELLGKIKPLIPVAIALAIVAALSWFGWQFVQKEFGPSVLGHLASLSEEQQFEAFLKLSDEQFENLMADPQLLSENSAAFSINDRLDSFKKLSDQRSDKWRYVLWPKLNPKKQVELLLKLPKEELTRQIEGLTRDGQAPLIELFNFKETSSSQLTALARQLDKQQQRLLLSNPAVKRRVDVLGGFEPLELADMHSSVMTSLSTDQLAALVIDLPKTKLQALLLNIPPEKIKTLFDHRMKNALIAKLREVDLPHVARLLPAKQESQTASNSTSFIPMPMPKPMVDTKPPPANDPPKDAPKKTRPDPMPPKPVAEVEKANTSDVKVGKPEPRIVYQDLPKYPKSKEEDEGQKEMVLELPKDAEPFTAIRLRGFDEHRTWFRDKKRPVPKTNEEENHKKLRVVFGSEKPAKETPPKTLCTFELRAPNQIAFDWEFQPDEPVQLQNAVRACVLEIQRDEQPAIFVSFLPHKLVEGRLRFGRDGTCSLTSSLKELQSGGSLQLSEGAIHVTAKQGRDPVTIFAFQPTSPPTGPSALCKIPELCKPFEFSTVKFDFSTAEVQLETKRVFIGIKEFADEQIQTQLVLNVSRNLNAEEQKKVDTLDDKLAVLRTRPSIARSSKSDPKTRHGALIDILVVLGLPEKKDKPPESPEYAQWAADIVTKDVPAKIKELKDEHGLVKSAHVKDRQQFLDLEPVISGTVVRVVDGIVVKALELRPRGIVEPKDTPK